jgi:hypothetical protein
MNIFVGVGVIYNLKSFLPEHHMEMIGQFHFLANLAQGKEPPVANK